MTILTLVFSLFGLYFLAVTFWIVWSITRDPRKTLSISQNRLKGAGISFEETRQTEKYTIRHTVEGGIERIHYTPKTQRHPIPILMGHGMWHGAWCWQTWQEILAEAGWESLAFSLPGHGKSPTQRPIRSCTLDYYLSFYRDEVEMLQKSGPTPILMGHSMGGALSQWYLRYVSDELPAVVLVAPWVADSSMRDGTLGLIKMDPIGVLQMFYRLDASSWVRSPSHAAQKLTSPASLLSPEELFSRLGPESALVVMQHNPPLWRPKGDAKSPILILAGEKDNVVSIDGLQRAAHIYKNSSFELIHDAAHNLMMESNYRETAAKIDGWLSARIRS